MAKRINNKITKYKTTARLSHRTYEVAYSRELKTFTAEVCASYRVGVANLLFSPPNSPFPLSEIVPQKCDSAALTIQKLSRATVDTTPVIDALPSDNIQRTLKAMIARWEKIATNKADPKVRRQLAKIQKYVDGKYKITLAGISGKSSPALVQLGNTRTLRDVKQALYFRNVSLIKSIPQNIARDYESAFFTAISGGDQESIIAQLGTIEDIAKRRAHFIARDQTAKMIDGINTARAADLHMRYYRWRTAEDERVSMGAGGHRHLNNKIFKIDEPEAVIDSYGHKGHPSERPNCRCDREFIIETPTMRFKKLAEGEGYEVINA